MKKKNRIRNKQLVFLTVLGLLLLIELGVFAIVWVNQLPGILVLSKNNPEQTAFMQYRAESGVSSAAIWR